MAKTYYLIFGSGDPVLFTGLTPTLISFAINGVSALPAPAITECSQNLGVYAFQYGTTQSILFKADGGSSLDPTSTRYIEGALDPNQAVDQQLGYSTDSFGSTAVDPSTLWGMNKRNMEFQEGNKNFVKATGIWDIYSRGSSTLLREKALTNTTTSAGST